MNFDCRIRGDELTALDWRFFIITKPSHSLSLNSRRDLHNSASRQQLNLSSHTAFVRSFAEGINPQATRSWLHHRKNLNSNRWRGLQLPDSTDRFTFYSSLMNHDRPVGVAGNLFITRRWPQVGEIITQLAATPESLLMLLRRAWGALRSIINETKRNK